MAKKKLTKIGRYKILGELGRGAMGIVYGAEDPALDRTVALKTIILSDEVEGRKEFHKRFFLEAKAAGKLTHPNIITVYDFGEEGDLAYMAMELLKGIELRAKMLQGPIPVVEAVDIAEQVADGLGYAHERGVVHRDIKPSNIMLLPRGQVKIMDFGIARAFPTTRRARASCWARPDTCPPSRWRDRMSTTGPTSSRSGSCSTRCSPAPRCSRARTRRKSCTTSSTSSTYR